MYSLRDGARGTTVYSLCAAVDERQHGALRVTAVDHRLQRAIDVLADERVRLACLVQQHPRDHVQVLPATKQSQHVTRVYIDATKLHNYSNTHISSIRSVIDSSLRRINAKVHFA